MVYNRKEIYFSFLKMTPLEEVKTLTRNFVEHVKIKTPHWFGDSEQILSFVTWALGLHILVLENLDNIKKIVVNNGIYDVHEYLQFTCEIKTSFLDTLGVVTLNGNDEEIEEAGCLIYDFKAFYEKWEGELRAIGAFYEDEFECRFKIS